MNEASTNNKRSSLPFKLLESTVVENENFIAINKPAGLLSIPDRTQSEPSLKDILIAKYGNILTVHRIDKDTSGMIVFAKNEATHKFLSLAFEERKVEKFYQGIVHGLPAQKSGTIDAPISEHLIQKGVMVIRVGVVFDLLRHLFSKHLPVFLFMNKREEVYQKAKGIRLITWLRRPNAPLFEDLFHHATTWF